jgi:predicted dehydrogenase
VNVAIIGCGSIGSRHARNAKALGHDVLLCDVSHQNAASLAYELTLPAGWSDSPNPAYLAAADAVLICTPASTHELVATQILRDGYVKALFVEKPLALSSHAPIFQEWPHPVTMVGYNWRFHPEIVPLRELARLGGTLRLTCHTDMRTWPGTGYADPLLECSHEIDLACAWLGDPTSIEGGPWHGQGAWVQMQHPRGGSIIDVRWYTEALRELRLHLPGWTSVHAKVSVHPPGEGYEAPALRESYVLELQHFLDAVEGGTPTACPFQQGLRVVEICERVKVLAAV